MERIVGRDRLVSTSGGGYELVRRPLGNGHVECTVRELVTWHHARELTEDAYQQYLEAREANAEERHQANLERSAKRAKTRVRQSVQGGGSGYPPHPHLPVKHDRLGASQAACQRVQPSYGPDHSWLVLRRCV